MWESYVKIIYANILNGLRQMYILENVIDSVTFMINGGQKVTATGANTSNTWEKIDASVRGSNGISMDRIVHLDLWHTETRKPRSLFGDESHQPATITPTPILRNTLIHERYHSIHF